MAKGNAVLRVKFPGAKQIIAQLRAELLRLRAGVRK